MLNAIDATTLLEAAAPVGFTKSNEPKKLSDPTPSRVPKKFRPEKHSVLDAWIRTSRKILLICRVDADKVE
jgi:hypothetical protein